MLDAVVSFAIHVGLISLEQRASTTTVRNVRFTYESRVLVHPLTLFFAYACLLPTIVCNALTMTHCLRLMVPNATHKCTKRVSARLETLIAPTSAMQ